MCDRSTLDVWRDLLRVRERVPDVDPARLMGLVLAGKAQVFPLPSGSVVGVLTKDGRAHLPAGSAASMSDILAAETAICSFYRERGATSLSLMGRKGWRRVLAPLGWRPDGDLLVKDLSDGQQQGR